MSQVFSPTLFLLMATYGSVTAVRLDDVADLYFGMAPQTAKAKATAGLLPVPAFRASQKSPYLIHLVDLAEYIDAQRQAAAERMQRLSVGGKTA